MKMIFKEILKFLFTKMGLEIKRRSHSSYIDAKKTIKSAQKAGKSICEYVEEIWDIKGQTDMIIKRMRQVGALSQCSDVCEIGPGTGRYLERIIEEVKPHRYHIYEIDKDWRDFIYKTYNNVITHPADGHTLSFTESGSCGLVCAFGVFVYLSFLNSFEYFKEMIRVCSKGGFIMFDIFSDREWNEKIIERWLATKERYPVIIPEVLVVEYLKNKGCKLIDRFNVKYGQSYSTYLIFFKKQEKMINYFRKQNGNFFC